MPELLHCHDFVTINQLEYVDGRIVEKQPAFQHCPICQCVPQTLLGVTPVKAEAKA